MTPLHTWLILPLLVPICWLAVKLLSIPCFYVRPQIKPRVHPEILIVLRKDAQDYFSRVDERDYAVVSSPPRRPTGD